MAYAHAPTAMKPPAPPMTSARRAGRSRCGSGRASGDLSLFAATARSYDFRHERPPPHALGFVLQPALDRPVVASDFASPASSPPSLDDRTSRDDRRPGDLRGGCATAFERDVPASALRGLRIPITFTVG